MTRNIGLAVLVLLPGAVLLAAPGAVHQRLTPILGVETALAPAAGLAGGEEADDPYREAAGALYAAYEERAARVERGLLAIAGLLYLGVAGRWIAGRAEARRRVERDRAYDLHLRTLMDGVQAVEEASSPDETGPRMEVLAAARRRAERDWHAGLLARGDVTQLYTVYQAGAWAATQRMTRQLAFGIPRPGDSRPVSGRAVLDDAGADALTPPEAFFARPGAAEVPADAPRHIAPEPVLPSPTPAPADRAPAPKPARPWYLDETASTGSAADRAVEPPAPPRPRPGVIDYAYRDDEPWDAGDDSGMTEGIIGPPMVRRRAADGDAPAWRVEHEALPHETRAPREPARPHDAQSSQRPAKEPEAEKPAAEEHESVAAKNAGKRAARRRAPKQRGGKRKPASEDGADGRVHGEANTPAPPAGETSGEEPREAPREDPGPDAPEKGQLDLGF